MNSLTPDLNLPHAEVRLSTMLQQVADYYRAEYVLSLFAPSGSEKYGCSIPFLRSANSRDGVDEKLKFFAESLGELKRARMFSSLEIHGRNEKTYKNEDLVTEYLFYPLFVNERTESLLIIGGNKGVIENLLLPESMIEDLIRITAAETAVQQLLREGIYAACRQLVDVKDDHQLEQILRKYFNPLFKLAGSGILALRKGDTGTTYLFFTDQGVESAAKSGTEPENFPFIVDPGKYREFFKLLPTESPGNLIHHFDLDQANFNQEIFPFIQKYLQKDVTKFAMLPLFRNQEVIGYWMMAYSYGITAAMFSNEVFQVAAEHIAAAITGILVQNSLKDKVGEVEVLHWLNQLLATSRDRKSLIRTIRSRLENMFAFSHSFICNVNDDDITLNLLLADSQSRAQFHPRYEELKSSRLSVADGFLNKVILTTEPVVFDLEKLNQTRQLPLYMRVNYESGIVKMLMLSLRINTNVIGIWMICFTEAHPVLPKYLELVKILAAPISLAVSNIRMEDSLRERDAERDNLMSLSSDITSVKSIENLNSVLIRHLNRLLGRYDMAAFVLSDDGVLQPFVSSAGSNSSNTSIRPNNIDGDNQRLMNRFFASSDVNVVEINEFTDDRQFQPFFTEYAGNGAKSVVAIALRNDDRQIGIFCLLLREKESLTDHQLTLFKEISYQVSKALLNILANEELARGDWEKGLLLSLSKDLASVRQKEHLISAVKKTLKSALEFSHIALCLKAEHRIISFALDPDSKVRDHPGYKAATRDNIPFNDEWVKIFEESTEPVIISKSDLTNSPELSPIMKLNFDCGINEMVITKLYDGVRYFGFWVTFNERESTDFQQLKFIQSIANQLSTALLNVLANQEIADRDEDKEYLLQLGNAMAGIRSYSEFFQFVSKECATKFGFGRSSIIIAESDNGSEAKVLGSGSQENTFAMLSAEGSLKPHGNSGKLLTALTDNTSLLIVDPKNTENSPYFDLLGLHPEHPDKVIIAKFHHRNRILGAWIMYYPKRMEIGSRSLRLMEAVSGQLSIVIENIFADEREALFASQKSILFSLSQHVSAARNLSSLLDAMDQHVRSVLGYYHTNINLLHDDKRSLLPWNDAVKSEDGPQSDCPIISLTPLKNELIEQVMLTTEPQLFDLSDQESIGLGRYKYFEVHEDHKVTHALLTRLEVKGEVLGLWVICFESRPAINQDYINLVKGIRDTLSLGTLNIILNERIRRREHEKSGLLDFSNAVAGVKDKFQLGTIFHTYLQNLCNLDEVCLHWLDEKREMQFGYLWDPDSTYAGDPEFAALNSAIYPVYDGIIDKLLSTSAPVYVDIDEICGQSDAPNYLRFLKKHGFKSVVALPIFKGDEIAGALFVKHYDMGEADQPLFRSLSSQLAIAVSDLIATDRVIQQLAEINRYKQRLEDEKVYLTQELDITHNYSEIIGNSPALGEVFRMISQVSVSDSTVLILGETGTGKELIARAIHNDSPRRNNLLVKVNCAALPANLIESELFGHEKGSFTGATERRVGKFELANGGTLFLDEIGEMPPELQVKLLRALQEKEIERIGGKGTIKADVRIVAATNRNLEQEINAGRFRTDLYFRISTFPIHLPALRDRTEDIPLLAMHFVKRFAKRSGKVIDNISGRAMNELIGYSWPGNIRELEHQIERCVLMTNGSTIKEVHLPSTVHSGVLKEIPTAKFIPGTFDDFEKDYIIKTLKYCNGKVSGTGGAAEVLGIPASTLTSRMKRLNITKKIVEKMVKGLL